MAFLDFLFGQGEKTQEFQKFTGPQQDVLQQLLGGGQQGIDPMMQFLMQILSQNPELMKQFEAPALRQFEEQILPSIAERFTGQRGAGSQRSSAFGQQLGQAGAGLQERLAAGRAGLGMQAGQQLQSLLGMGLTPQIDRLYTPRQPGFLENILTTALPAVPAGIAAIKGGL